MRVDKVISLSNFVSHKYKLKFVVISLIVTRTFCVERGLKRHQTLGSSKDPMATTLFENTRPFVSPYFIKKTCS